MNYENDFLQSFGLGGPCSHNSCTKRVKKAKKWRARASVAKRCWYKGNRPLSVLTEPGCESLGHNFDGGLARPPLWLEPKVLESDLYIIYYPARASH